MAYQIVCDACGATSSEADGGVVQIGKIDERSHYRFDMKDREEWLVCPRCFGVVMAVLGPKNRDPSAPRGEP